MEDFCDYPPRGNEISFRTVTPPSTYPPGKLSTCSGLYFKGRPCRHIHAHLNPPIGLPHSLIYLPPTPLTQTPSSDSTFTCQWGLYISPCIIVAPESQWPDLPTRYGPLVTEPRCMRLTLLNNPYTPLLEILMQASHMRPLIPPSSISSHNSLSLLAPSSSAMQ